MAIASKAGVTVRGVRNVTLEDAIRRDVNPKTDAYVRFLSLTFEPPSESDDLVVYRTYWKGVRRSVIEALQDHLSTLYGGRAYSTSW